MVTLAIFIAVTTVLLGSFITLFSAREHMELAQSTNDSIRLILDGIDREMQAGSDITVSEDGSAIQFTVSSRGDTPPYRVQYRLRNGVIEKAVQKDEPGDPCAELAGGMLAEVCYLPVTDTTTTIQTLQFSVVVPHEEDGQTSPLVTLAMSGTVEDSSGKLLYITYSTSITPRNRISVGGSDTASGSSPAPTPGGSEYCRWTNAYGTHEWEVGTNVVVGGISGISCKERFCCEGASTNPPNGLSVCSDKAYADEECP
jgi:hypothetical protein